MRRDSGRILLEALLSILMSAVAVSSPVPVTLVVPVIEGSEVVRQTDPAGASFPVFRSAPDTAFFARIRKVLSEEPAQASLRLDRYARNARIAEETAKGQKPGAGLTMPMVLLVSSAPWRISGDANNRTPTVTAPSETPSSTLTPGRVTSPVRPSIS